MHEQDALQTLKLSSTLMYRELYDGFLWCSTLTMANSKLGTEARMLETWSLVIDVVLALAVKFPTSEAYSTSRFLLTPQKLITTMTQMDLVVAGTGRHDAWMGNWSTP